MSSELKHRRGTAAAHAGFIGAPGEITVKTDTNEIVVHDGVKAGGHTGGGYTPTGTGAVATNVQSKLRETVSVFDFMTEAQIADVQAGTGSIDVTAAIQTAIATGKDIEWPAGVYLISGTLTGVGAWHGSGQGGGVYDSTFSGSGTFIRLSGANSGSAFLNPPKDFDGFHIDGVTKAGIAIDLGANASFTALQRWKNITIRRCADALRGFNFYSTALENVVIQGNTRGVTITPTDGAGDDGYFTSTSWKNIHIADNDVYGLNASVPQGTRTWTCENIVIERNGATGGTYQASLTNVSLTGNGMYFEGSSSIPALKLNVANLVGADWYFNATGGIDASNAAAKVELSKLDMTSSTDVLANFPSTARLTLKNSSIYTDLRQASHMVSLENVTMSSVGVTEMFRVRRFSVGQSADPAYQPGEMILSYAGKKTVSTTINANSSVQIVGDTYFPSISTDAVGFGQVQGYYPGLIVQVTPATTGNTTYYTVRLINTTGANITLTSVQVTWCIFRFNPVAVA